MMQCFTPSGLCAVQSLPLYGDLVPVFSKPCPSLAFSMITLSARAVRNSWSAGSTQRQIWQGNIVFCQAGYPATVADEEKNAVSEAYDKSLGYINS